MVNFRSNRPAVLATGCSVVGVVGALAVVGIVNDHKDVRVDADGVSHAVSGFFPTVSDALAAAQVVVGPHDEVMPAGKQPLEDGMVVEVRRADSFVTDAGRVWSTADSLAEVLQSQRADWVRVNRLEDTTPVTTSPDAEEVALRVDGDESLTRIDAGDTVGEVLEDAEVELGPLDMVSVAMDDASLAIVVETQDRGTEVTTRKLPIPEKRQDDPELERGVERVVEEGEEGQHATHTYRQLRGGKVLVEATVFEGIVREPTARVIRVGTKEPEPEPELNSVSSSAGEAPASAPAFAGDEWAALAQCESGGNPSANTGNGYYGMYQFTEQTWQSVGGTGLPSDASAEEQTARAQALQQRSGWGQWPGCTSSLGLR